MANRRSILVGLGGLVAGGGALIGTGAFTTVEAERTVTVETAGDANAFLALEPADRGSGNNEYVSVPEDGTLSIDLANSGDNSDGSADGLNQNAETTFRNLVSVTNNGTQDVTELLLNMSVSGDSEDNINADETFHFTVTDPDDDDYEATFDNSDGSADNILTGNNDVPGSLDSGSSINFGLIVDLLDGGNNNNALPSPGNIEYTLTITANTSDSS